MNMFKLCLSGSGLSTTPQVNSSEILTLKKEKKYGF